MDRPPPFQRDFPAGPASQSGSPRASRHAPATFARAQVNHFILGSDVANSQEKWENPGCLPPL